MSKNSERVKLWRRRHPDRARDAQAVTNARRGGYAPPAQRERDCPPRSSDGVCWLCLKPAARLYRDHDQTTGAFRGWPCFSCISTLGKVEAIGLDRISDYRSGNLPWL
jgi:Recombination endonuclease VII